MVDLPTPRRDEGALRALVPRVLAGLLRRGEDFDAAEDALQEALLEALRVWPEHPPRDPRAWLTTVATRRLVDAVGHVLGAAAGLRETDRLRDVIGERHRWHAVRGHLHELGGGLTAAAASYAAAARRATNVAERDHLVRQAARARALAESG